MKATNTPIVRCAIYTRKSIEKGLDQEFNSLDAQKEVCMRCIASHAAEGWTLVGTYVDAAVSGTTVEREQLCRLRAQVRAGNLDCVVVYKLDRLSRYLPDYSTLMREFKENNVAFVSATQTFENKTPEGQFTMNMMAAVADFEAAMIRTRLRDKFNAAKAKGYWVAGKPPYGYTKPKKSPLVMNEEEADNVRRIFALFVEGYNYLEIQKVLKKENRFYRTTQGHTAPTPWNSQILYRILTHPVYPGKIQTAEGLVQGVHQPIVSQEQFDKAAERLELLKRDTGKPRRNVEYPLKGLLFCGHCESPYIGTYTVKDNVVRRYYVCKETKGPYAKGCKESPKFGADQLEGFLKQYLVSFRDNPQLLAALLEQMEKEDACRIADLLYSIDVVLAKATPKELSAVFKATFKRIDVNPNTDQLDVTLHDL